MKFSLGRQIVFYSLWLVTIFFAFKLAVIALSYFSFDTDYHFMKSKQDLLWNDIWMIAFYVHLFFGVIATLSGFPLFFKRLVHFKSKWHRWIGKAYIYSILLFTGPTGLYLAFYAEGGYWASVGFIMMSMAWMFPTYMAFYKIINKDIKGHYRWIIRSYCMTLSGVTLRIYTPIGSQYFQFDEETNFVISAFVWIINIILGELILLANRKQEKNLNLLIE